MRIKGDRMTMWRCGNGLGSVFQESRLEEYETIGYVSEAWCDFYLYYYILYNTIHGVTGVTGAGDVQMGGIWHVWRENMWGAYVKLLKGLYEGMTGDKYGKEVMI